MSAFIIRRDKFDFRMAFLRCFKEKTVTILEDDSEDFEKITILSMHMSLTDLQSLSMLVEEVLGRHGPFLKGCKLYEAIFASLFSYDCHAFVIRAFCERWCPITNTLHTSIGEVSISLWELSRIAGLPIIGSFYDEMVPSAEELSNEATKSSLPPSFTKYVKPPKRSTRNKARRPKETHNPSKEIDPAKSYTQSEMEVFDNLGVAEAYADWWIRVHNLDKEILTISYMEPPPDSSRKIPSKSLESRTRKVDSSVSTKESVRDSVEKDFDDLPDDSRASSKSLIGGHQTNTSTHPEHEETIFNGGSTHCHKTFKKHNNAHGLYVSDDDSEDTSECHFKRRKIRPNPVYYDETNSHSLNANVFFADVPTSTQPMELDGEEIGVDPSPLKSQIEKYMESVNHLDAVQHTHSMKMSPEVQSERLAIVASQIVDTLKFEGVDLATLDAKQEALKKELEQLCIQNKHIHNSISEIDEIIANKQNDVSRLRKEHFIIAQTSMLTDVDVKTLETLQETLRT
uniref:Aminotransferase-like plant mobile domain-containing protein n=1 Tax=Vitis vinifera TaxID=29760 RepID=A5AFJ6_VITVI|nr:hypothetical protein VITISV_029286 [Vitis vinifera]